MAPEIGYTSDSTNFRPSFSKRKEIDEGNFTEAQNVEIQKKEEEYQHKALAKPIKIMRHHLMEGQDREYVKDIVEEIDLDQKLELKKQEAFKQAELLQKDIDELTKSNNYFEVSNKGLEKLFKIKKLKMKTVPFNLKILFITSLLYIPILLTGLSIFLFVAGIVIHNIPFKVGLICSCAISLAVTIMFFISIFKSRDAFQFINVHLRKEKVQDTCVRIPKGAKLKLLEAKESGIFNSYSIAYPEIYSKHPDSIKSPRMDPAILANTVDGRMFMVVWWDVEKDIERSITDINKFKQFKL